MKNSGRVNEFYVNLKKQTDLLLGEILGEENTEELERVEKTLLGFDKPRQFGGSGGAEVAHIKNFEDTFIVMNQSIPKDPRTMTVLEFYRALELLEKQNK